MSRIDLLHVSQGGDDPGPSVLVEFDAIDVGRSDAFASFRADDTDPFALVWILANRQDFATNARRLPLVGEWFGITVAPTRHGDPEPGHLQVFHAQLGAQDYGEAELGRLTSLTPMPRPARSVRRGVGGLPSVVVEGTTHRMPPSLALACEAPPSSRYASRVSAILSDVPRPSSVLVRDVGQASFSSLCDRSGRAVLHYDVGLPVSFNRDRAAPEFDLTGDGCPPVVLSHWDWDHLSAALRHRQLLDSPWIVPAQRLGPGAARLSRMLRSRGNLHVRPKGPPTSFALGTLARAGGSRRSLNDTGLTLGVELDNGRTVMLTGDAGYSHCGQPHGPVDHLVATHHGARFRKDEAYVPRPRGRGGRLALSFGKGNVYRHPDDGALDRHREAGWEDIVSTAESRCDEVAGDVVLA